MQYNIDNPTLKEALERAMRGTGRMGRRHRLEIITISGDKGSDYIRVECHLYVGRAKEPFMYWNLCVDMARSLVYWEHSTFYEVK